MIRRTDQKEMCQKINSCLWDRDYVCWAGASKGSSRLYNVRRRTLGGSHKHRMGPWTVSLGPARATEMWRGLNSEQASFKWLWLCTCREDVVLMLPISPCRQRASFMTSFPSLVPQSACFSTSLYQYSEFIWPLAKFLPGIRQAIAFSDPV